MANISAKRITALLSALVFILSMTLTGCQIGGSDDQQPTTPTSSSTNAYIPEGESIVCPKCGSANTDDVLSENEKYDEHYVCYDCGYEWYVINGEAYEVKAEGEDVKINNYSPVYRPNYNNHGGSGNGGGSSSGNGGSGSGNGSGNGGSGNGSGSGNGGTGSGGLGGNGNLGGGLNFTDEELRDAYEYIQSGKWLNFLYIDQDGNITTEQDEGVAGFGYSTRDKCFYATGNAWQRNFGYNELYDKTSQLIAISYDTINIYFNYRGKDWMIQLWKGQYGMVLIGAEVGIYNRTEGMSYTTHYNAVKDNELLPVSLTLYNDDKRLFSRSLADSWWQTGFVPGQLGITVGVLVGSIYTNNLKATVSIVFDNETMTQAFVGGLRNVTTIYNNVDGMDANDVNKGYRRFVFMEGDGNTPGTYKIEGNKVTLSWQ